VPNKQILASEAVVETAGNAAFGFERIEDAELKGLPGPVARLPSHTERAGLRSHTKLTGSIVVRGL
jgi:class 3 adenylate cyclase